MPGGGFRPWRTLRGRLALGTVVGLLIAGGVVTAVAVSLAERQGERTAREEFDRQAVEIGRIVSARAQRAAETGQRVRVDNLEALVGPGAKLGYAGILPVGSQSFGPAPAEVARRIDQGVLENEVQQRVDYVADDGSRVFATAVALEIGGLQVGSLVLSRPAGEFDTPIGDALPRVSIAVGLGLLVALTVILLVERWATRPIRTLERGTARVADGDLTVELPRGGPAELDALAGAFNEMVGELRHRDTTARDFLMQITHDLRTPLTAIQGHAQALSDRIVPEAERDRSAEAIAAEAARLERLVADLLDLARLQAHRFHLDIDEVDPEDVLDHAVQAFSSAASEKGIAYENAIARLPRLRTDGVRLYQIVANLIENALRWTPQGGTVRVNARPHRGGLRVAVEDTGPGITADRREDVFEPFLSHAPPDGQRGTGLGLAISRELARALGGELDVESTPGQGSRFVLVLPGRPDEPAPEST